MLIVHHLCIRYEIPVYFRYVDNTFLLIPRDQENLNIISKLLTLNSFPIHFVNEHINKRLKEMHLKLNNDSKNLENSLENSSNNRIPIVSVPYYCNLSEIVKRLL